jgi:hypothetical protein
MLLRNTARDPDPHDQSDCIRVLQGPGTKTCFCGVLAHFHMNKSLLGARMSNLNSAASRPHFGLVPDFCVEPGQDPTKVGFGTRDPQLADTVLAVGVLTSTNEGAETIKIATTHLPLSIPTHE